MLHWCMYGTRDAAAAWEDTYTRLLEKAGFKRGKTSSSVFWNASRRCRIVVHGDDFTILGPKSSVHCVKEILGKELEMKDRGTIGWGRHDQLQVNILNRRIPLDQEGIHYEGDHKHQAIIRQTLGLEHAKAVSTPGVKEGVGDRQCEEEPMDTDAVRRYRAITARANFLGIDRPDLAYATKEACRRMSCPCPSDEHLLKRLGRYLAGAPRLIYDYIWQSQGHLEEVGGLSGRSKSSGHPEPRKGSDTDYPLMRLDVYSDSDWAGCPRTRRSTSGGAIMLGTHLLKHWSSTQSTIALSSGEAELYAMVKAATEAIGFRSLCADLGIQLEIHLHSDSSAAIGMGGRTGVGKVRHLEVAGLWIQDKIRSGNIILHKVDGKRNPADLLTKHVTREELERHVQTLGLRIVPQVHGTKDDDLQGS